MKKKKEIPLWEDNKLGSDIPQGNNIVVKEFYVDEHYICDEQVKICRTKTSGKNYQMVFWIKGENKHFRKSLRETNLERAKEKPRVI